MCALLSKPSPCAQQVEQKPQIRTDARHPAAGSRQYWPEFHLATDLTRPRSRTVDYELQQRDANFPNLRAAASDSATRITVLESPSTQIQPARLHCPSQRFPPYHHNCPTPAQSSPSSSAMAKEPIPFRGVDSSHTQAELPRSTQVDSLFARLDLPGLPPTLSWRYWKARPSGQLQRMLRPQVAQ